MRSNCWIWASAAARIVVSDTMLVIVGTASAWWYFELRLLKALTVIRQLAKKVATDTVTERGSIAR